MRKSSVLLLIVLLAVGLAAFYFVTVPQKTPNIQAIPDGVPVASETAPSQSPSPSPSFIAPAPDATPRTKVSPTVSFPTSEELHSEVQAHPEVTPPSLLRVSRELFKKTQDAKRSEAEAVRFFSELESNCLGQSLAAPVQSLCLSSAQELAGQYPALKARDAQLEANASPEVKHLRQMLEKLSQ
jgi:hypothetical protein